MADICGIYGLQGCGKTMALTALAKQRYHQGRKLYSNYHLKRELEYEPVETLGDMAEMRHGMFLGDELWVWLNARTSMKKMNQEITKIVMLNRKRDVDIFYTCQLPRTVDVLLREVTTSWIRPHIIPLKTQNGDRAFGVKCVEINSLGEIVNKFRLKNDLEYWGSYYDTTEEIGDIKKQENKGGKEEKTAWMKQALELERQWFKLAAPKLDWVRYIDWFEHSGRYTDWMFDGVIYTIYGVNIAIDVKSSNETRVTVDPNNISEQIKNARQHNAVPMIAFPVNDKDALYQPRFWRLHPLENTYIKDYNSYPRYNKLEKHSIPGNQFNEELILRLAEGKSVLQVI